MTSSDCFSYVSLNFTRYNIVEFALAQYLGAVHLVLFLGCEKSCLFLTIPAELSNSSLRKLYYKEFAVQILPTSTPQISAFWTPNPISGLEITTPQYDTALQMTTALTRNVICHRRKLQHVRLKAPYWTGYSPEASRD